MIQLNPMVPVYIPRFDMEGYAFLATRNTQEHYLILSVILDNGEIWELSNREVRGCINHTMDRHKINKSSITEFKDKFNDTTTCLGTKEHH